MDKEPYTEFFRRKGITESSIKKEYGILIIFSDNSKNDLITDYNARVYIEAMRKACYTLLHEAMVKNERDSIMTFIHELSKLESNYRL